MSGHELRAHAILSASGSSRWLNCTPSAREEEKKGGDTSSVYAQEGTLAHELADLELNRRAKNIGKQEYADQLKKLKAHELYNDDMPIEVAKYVDYIFEEYTARLIEDENTELAIEERLDFSEYVPEGFGTGDAQIIGGGTLEVVDLKYGKGIQVDAEDNPQLKLYGLGAYSVASLIHDEIEIVKLTIVQPRLNHYSTVEITVGELLDWGENYVKPRAEKAIKGEGDKVPGEWCKFCKVAATCKALRDKAVSIAKDEFKVKAQIGKAGANPSALTDEELLDIYDNLPLFEFWAGAIRNHFLQTAIEGKKWPGLKLVEGRSQRKITDEEEMANRLKSRKIPINDFMPRKLVGIAQLEKLLGAKRFSKAVGDLVYKPEGKPTLVPETDKRPELTGTESAKRDFN